MRVSLDAPEFFVSHEISPNALEAMVFRPVDHMGNFNQNMFNDDFHNMFFGGSRRDANTFRISSNNQELQDKLVGAFVIRHNYSGGHSIVEELVEEVVQSLICHGKAVYILQEHEDEGQFFRAIPASSIFRFLGLVFQYIPRRVRRHWDRDDELVQREIRFLKRQNLLFFDWKRSIQRKVRYQNRILKTLDRYAHDGGVKHMPRPTHENPNPKNHFDFRVWKEVQDEALFTATRLTGWSRTVSSHTNRSDFFICHRLIRFRKLQVELASHVLDTLSDQLTNIGKQEDVSFQLCIEFSDEYQSIAKLEELERRLEREEVGFGEILNYCFQS
ncbi:hypothetical protein R1T40_18465 [Tritonibacter scottomollicae]|uniref:Uncharacterized protein n=1 Tax=Tritonibacter scottomollicae TaxID=483013 RepID=A0ABZ0HH69_TRISK|nr:hypothetical protein [Tritonibacter scottomollicae]WOI32897.1 hypothetical protein R1T40_18465 [Tritonibacter scottomollicae]